MSSQEFEDGISSDDEDAFRSQVVDHPKLQQPPPPSPDKLVQNQHQSADQLEKDAVDVQSDKKKKNGNKINKKKDEEKKKKKKNKEKQPIDVDDTHLDKKSDASSHKKRRRKKKKKNRDDDDVQEIESGTHIQNKKPRKQVGFEKVWFESDEIALLRGAIDYKTKYDCHTVSISDMDAFLKSIEPTLSFVPTKTQVYEKLRRLKEKYFKDSVPTKSDSANTVFELSKMMWGEKKFGARIFGGHEDELESAEWKTLFRRELEIYMAQLDLLRDRLKLMLRRFN